MQYGLDLTRALMHRIEALIRTSGGRLVVMQVDSAPGGPEDEEVYVLNDKYYRTSKRQARANWDYVNEGFDTEIIPVTVPEWRVSPDDAHLNASATEQVMIDLADRLRSRIEGWSQSRQTVR
jgi:hypothetical protein